jgi:CBS domain containing-hemolysin-like protein
MSDITQTATGAAPASAGAEQSDEGSSPDPSSGQQAPTFIQRLAGVFRNRNGSSLREDLTDALAEAAHAADFSPAERAMLKNILRLREVRVEDVMIPRGDVQAVEIATTLGELLSVFEKSGHSRMPVYSESLDDPRGMVHIRDLLGHLTRLARAGKTTRGRGRATQPRNGDAKPEGTEKLDLGRVDLNRAIGELGLVRPILFVPPSMLASDLMARMQAARIQMALVIDEYGGTDGLVSLEDIVEMVVGDIEDEHDEDEAMITRTGEGVFVVDGKAEIEEVAEMIGEAFKAGEHEEDVDTIGGMIFNTLGRVPARGEVVQAIPGFEFHVLDADPRRVKRVRIVQSRAADRRRRLPKPAVGIDA